MKKLNQNQNFSSNQFQGTFNQENLERPTHLTAAQRKRQKMQNLEEMGVKLPNNLLNEGVMTGEIGEIEPRAETIEI